MEPGLRSLAQYCLEREADNLLDHWYIVRSFELLDAVLCERFEDRDLCQCMQYRELLGAE